MGFLVEAPVAFVGDAFLLVVETDFVGEVLSVLVVLSVVLEDKLFIPVGVIVTFDDAARAVARVKFPPDDSVCVGLSFISFCNRFLKSRYVNDRNGIIG